MTSGGTRASRGQELLEAAAVATYMVGAATWLRVSGRIRPRRSLAYLGALAAFGATCRGLARLTGAPATGPLERITPLSGRAYVGRLPRLNPFMSDEEGWSSLELLEDGRPLGPPHTAQTEVARRGRGSFIHWGAAVVFSASDDSDPRTNGRAYTWRGPGR